ncbi:MAG: hypothetical protein JWN02_1297, partial [Acidobacteria bacterium]|nr:hypothetical protein [Acidobacteriota bacterium]
AAPPPTDDSRRGGLLRAPREPAEKSETQGDPTTGQESATTTPSHKGKRKPPKEKPTRPCLCGCGIETKSAFAAGHDSRVKGTLIKTLFGSIENMMAWSKTPDGIKRAKAQAEQ